MSELINNDIYKNIGQEQNMFLNYLLHDLWTMKDFQPLRFTILIKIYFFSKYFFFHKIYLLGYFDLKNAYF